MIRIITAIAIALPISSAAFGQTQTFHDGSGRVTGHARSDSEGTTTFYDAAGRVSGRARTDANGVTTFTDAVGRVTGKASAPRRF